MKLHLGKVIGSLRKYKIIDCEACGFFHIKPLPKKEEVRKIYRNIFYQVCKPTYLSKMEKERDYWDITYRDKMEIFQQYVRKKKKRILDIGCGGGFFLTFFKNNGWDTLGIEPSIKARNYAYRFGLNILNKSFEDVSLKEIGRFDVVHLSFLLEHLLDPEYVLRKIYNILKIGGIICIESPNDFNPLQKIIKEKLGKKPWWIAPAEHINYFTVKSLKNLIERCGFEALKVCGTFPMEFFVLMGRDYIGNDRVGRRCHKMRMNLETHLYKNGLNNFKKELYQYMIDRNIGREVILYGKK